MEGIYKTNLTKKTKIMNLQRINKLITELELNKEFELLNFYKEKRLKLITEIELIIKEKTKII
tara:strand:+ start:804 stop:992 length:189 start_codon:yes stop_codon:yes gene_type:complete